MRDSQRLGEFVRDCERLRETGGDSERLTETGGDSERLTETGGDCHRLTETSAHSRDVLYLIYWCVAISMQRKYDFIKSGWLWLQIQG